MQRLREEVVSCVPEDAKRRPVPVAQHAARACRTNLPPTVARRPLPVMKEIKIIDVDEDKAGSDREMLLQLWTKRLAARSNT